MAYRADARSAGVQLIDPGQKRQRVQRHPKHTFYLQQKPFLIQPFMIAPVLPGETLDNMLCQVRAVTNPVKNPIIGWWFEMYWFYVKHRDMDDREAFTNFMIDPAVTLTALKETDDTVSQYFNPGVASQLNWLEKAYKVIVETYFRGQSEAWNNIQIDGLSVASIVGNSWADSFVNDDAFQTAIEPTVDTSGATVGITAIETAMRQWELLRLNNLTDLTYDDYLRTYGVSIPKEDPNVPELIRYVRDWQYPSNTIDPTSGAPTSAVSWALQERADKKRFFKEPGFIIGLSICRPKVYLSGQKSYAATMLDDVYTWLPAVLSDDPETSLKQFTAGANGGILPGNTDDYWVDVADLFLHGDQFVNVDPTTAGINSLALPTAAGVWRYPSNQAMLDTLTVSANAVINVDGVCSLNIASRLRDQS